MPSPPPYAIRRLAPGDVPTFRALMRVFGAAFGQRALYRRGRPSRAYVNALLAKPHVIVLAAMAGSGRAGRGAVPRVAGGLLAYVLDKPERARTEVYLYDLAVAARHRRRGVATALIAELGRVAADRGARVIFVQADHGDDPAIALYTKLGRREDVMHFDIAVPRIAPRRRAIRRRRAYSTP